MSASSSSAGRILRRVLIGLGALVALAIAAVVVFLLTFDATRYKPRIAAAVQQATGRTLTLAGPLHVRFALHPTIEAQAVTLANPPGFSRPDMVRLRALDVRLGLLALLHGRIAIDRLVLVRPDILLERTRTGAVNWRFAPASTSAVPGSPPPAPTSPDGHAPAANPPAAPPPGPAAPAATPPGKPVFIRDLRIEGGTIGYRDDTTGRQITVALHQASLRAAGPDAPLRLDAAATVNGVPLTLAGTTGPLAGLQHAGSSPWPVQLALTAADARLAATGTIADPAAGRGVAIDFDLHVPDLAGLGTLAQTALPPLQQIALTGKLVAPGRPLVQGAQVQDLALSLPQGRLTGQLGLRLGGGVPAVSGTLHAASLDADALLAALHRPAPAAPAAPPPAGGGTPAPAAPRPGLLIPATPLPLGLLRTADADLTVSVAALRTGGETWHDLAFHLVLAGGKLVLAPFTATPPAGKLSLRLTVDATQAAPPVAVTLHAPGLALASLLALAGETGLARGDVAIDADLHGAGISPHAIAAGLDGTVAATMTGGTIDNAVVNRLFGGVLARANLAGLLAHGGASEIRCVAVRAVASHGVARLDPFLFSSTLTTIGGSGTMNLGAETLDLVLRPQGRVGGTGFSVPVTVTGGFAHPAIRLSPTGTVQAGIGAALSYLAGKTPGVPQALAANGPSCASALAMARGAAAPAPAPAPPAAPSRAAKPALPNPGTLLKNLFR